MSNVNYLWQEFNIKTFPSETIVYRDGIFMPELSTLQSAVIDKKYDLPVHIIYIGEISGEQNLDIEINTPAQEVFLTVKIENKSPAVLNIFVKNTGEKSFLRGTILAQNYDELKINVTGHHLAKNTGIILQTRVVAHSASKTKLIGTAQIDKDCKNCESDVGFSVLADPSAIIEFMPKQLISAAPISAEHSASLYHGTAPQVEYLRTAGMTQLEIKTVLREAFLNDI